MFPYPYLKYLKYHLADLGLINIYGLIRTWQSMTIILDF